MNERYKAQRYLEGYEAARADASKGTGFVDHTIQIAEPAAMQGLVNAHWFQGYRDGAAEIPAAFTIAQACGMN